MDKELIKCNYGDWNEWKSLYDRIFPAQFTIREIEKMTDINISVLSHWKNGSIRPSIKAIEKAARQFNKEIHLYECIVNTYVLNEG